MLVSNSDGPDHAKASKALEDADVLSYNPKSDRHHTTQAASVCKHVNLQECQKELDHTKQLLEIQTKHANALQRKVHSLEQDLKKQHGDLRHEINMLSKQLLDAQAHESLSIEAQLVEAKYQFDNCGPRAQLLKENERLLIELEYQTERVQHWRAEAFCQGSKTVIECLQAAVDEKVRQVREQDAYLVKNLNEQIAELNVQNAEEATKRKEADNAMAVMMRDENVDWAVHDDTWLSPLWSDWTL